MPPQSTFTILVPIRPEREAELRGLLASMNDAPGRVNVNNSLIPFARLEMLHVARLLVLDDKTLDDIRVYRLPRREYPLYLAFIGNLDGDPAPFFEELRRHAAQGLRAIFSCCEGFRSDADLVAWMKAHNRTPIATYVNWRGRTVRAGREDSALYELLERHVDSQAAALAGLSATEVHSPLRGLIEADVTAGRLTLSRERATPLRWRVANLLHLIGFPLLLLLVSPLLVVIGIVFLVRLRRLEKTDPELIYRVDEEYSNGLALLEDHDVMNQFTALGSVKPGIVRLWTITFVLWLVDYLARHAFTRGRLLRIRTIHFARWVFLDGRKRAVFFSDYDGSFEAYMDDFINKMGFGLNIVFSNGVGY